MSYTSRFTRTLPELGKAHIESHLAEDGSGYIEVRTHVGTEAETKSRLDIPAALLSDVYSETRRLGYLRCQRPGSTENFVASLDEDTDDDSDDEDDGDSFKD